MQGTPSINQENNEDSQLTKIITFCIIQVLIRKGILCI